MTRVSTTNSYSAVLANLMKAQQSQFEAQNQVTSEKKATDLRGFSQDAEALVAARTVSVRAESYIKLSETLKRKLDSQDLSLNRVADATLEAKSAIGNAIASGNGTTLMQSLQIQFGSVLEGLNGQHEGEYLFSGSQTSTKPVQVADMAALGATTVAAVCHNDSIVPVSRLDESTTVTTGFLADTVGTPVMAAFKAIQDYVNINGTFGTTLTTAQSDFLTSQLAVFGDANRGLVDQAALNGSIHANVDNSIADQTSRKTAIDNAIVDISGVNMADAVTRLQRSQQAVQAAAQVFVTLKNSSLLNYLN